MDETARGVMVGGAQRLDARTGKPTFSLDLLDLDGATVRRVALDFLAHGVAFDPKRHARAALFEKRGVGAALVDLDQGHYLKRILPTPGRAFYGHGAFDHDASVLFAVETSLDTHAGAVVVRDAKTLAVLGEFPTFGEDPHDLLLTGDGKTLVVTNGGGPLGSKLEPSVAFVDVAARKLLQKLTFSDPKINAGHVAYSAGGDLAVSSAPRSGLPEQTTVGGVTLRSARGKAERMRDPKGVLDRLLGEALSVCIHEPTRTAVVTCPLGDLVTVWSLATRKLKKSFDVVFPRGVALTLRGDTFVLTHGKDARVSFLDAETLTLSPQDGYGAGNLTGSHLFPWDPKAPDATA